MHMILNVVVFQITWAACVLGAASGFPWAGPAMAAVAASLHLWFAPGKGRELILMLAAAVLGCVFETALVQTGLVSYQSASLGTGMAPPWLIAMWFAFATLLNVSLRFLHGRFVIATVLGAILGPLAYLAGERLGGIAFPTDRTHALVALAVVWGIAMPLLTWLAMRLDGFTAKT